MEETKLKICRLCLTINSNHHMLSREHSDMLDLFLPKSPFIISEPSICRNCVSKLEIGYRFKLKCINNEEKIQTYINNLKLDFDIERIHPEIICCLCFNTDSSFNKIYVLSKYLTAYIPELDLMELGGAVVCNNCSKVVQSTYKFIKMCLEVEKKIDRYMSAEKVDEVNLNSMLSFLKTEKIKYNSKESYKVINNKSVNQKISELDKSGKIRSDIGTIKTEIVDKSSYQIETHYLHELRLDSNVTEGSKPELQDKTEAPLVGNIHVPFEPHYLEALNQPANSDINEHLKEEQSHTNLKVTDIPSKKFSCKKCSYAALTKNELKYHFFDHKNTVKMYTCQVCPFVTRHRNVIDNHNLTHLTDEEVVWYNCSMCTYRARIQGNLDKHKLTHNKQTDELKKYKCEECAYKSMWKRDLERHLVKHNQLAFSCDHCIFSTKHQRYLKQHVIRVHGTKENSSIETYYCANCSFSTKHKRSLIPHMVTHKKVEDLEWYTCQYCKYKAKWKRSLKIHEVIHLQKYKCNQCDFQTTLKRFLKEHVRGHLPITAYTCEICDFTTHVKQTMNQHNNKHKNPEDLPMHYCTHCEYKSKRLQDLKQHAILHEDNPEGLRCSICPYRTICKKRLRSHHRLMHGESGQLKRFQCSLCSFRTKYKTSFRNHQLCFHQEKDESALIKCLECDYKCNRKELLTRHRLVHKTVSEEEMFRCYNCDYKTKYKRALVKHVQGHQSPGAKKDIIIECGKCDYTTKWRYSMKKHMSKHIQEVKMEIDVDKAGIEWGPCNKRGPPEIKGL